MTQPFTATEVRRQGQLHRQPASDMLHAYADRLESDEKVVPVYQVAGLRTGSDWADCDEETFNAAAYWPGSNRRRILYTHPSPADVSSLLTGETLDGKHYGLHGSKESVEAVSDMLVGAERLAEALREILDYRGGAANALEDEYVVDRAHQALAAHSAQAQPPAASVPDIETMVNRFLSWRLPKPWNPDNGISYTRPNYAHQPAEHDWPTGTNLFDAHQAREMIEYMLATQEESQDE